MKKIEQHKIKCSDWFKSLRNSICKEIERLEESQFKFIKKKWLRDPKGSKDMGGGEMSLLRGKPLKRQVLIYQLFMERFLRQLKGKIPGTENSDKFWACRYFSSYSPLFSKNSSSSHEYTSYNYKKSWFGGGMDITPTNLKSNESKKLAEYFHQNLEKNL